MVTRKINMPINSFQYLHDPMKHPMKYITKIIIKTPFSMLTKTLIKPNIIRPWIFLWIPINSMARYAKHIILKVELWSRLDHDQSKPYLSYFWGFDHLRFSSHLGPVFFKKVHCLNTVFLNLRSLRALFLVSSWDGMVKQPLISLKLCCKIQKWCGSQFRFQ